MEMSKIKRILTLESSSGRFDAQTVFSCASRACVEFTLLTACRSWVTLKWNGQI